MAGPQLKLFAAPERVSEMHWLRQFVIAKLQFLFDIQCCSLNDGLHIYNSFCNMKDIILSGFQRKTEVSSFEVRQAATGNSRIVTSGEE